MNFFVFNTNTNTITIAGDFWVFVATWLPLTLITGLIYWLWYWYTSEGRCHKNEKCGKKRQDLFNIKMPNPRQKARGLGTIV